MIEEKIKQAIRDVKDFPKPDILFKDITPILQDPVLCRDIVLAMAAQVEGLEIDVVAGVESRGFLFGPSLAQELGLPFVPIRKEGKLPYKTVKQSYDLEYGSATIECHQDAFLKGHKVLVHDDLLATGGTVCAASELIAQLDATIAGFSFVVLLDFLNGRARLESYSNQIFSLVSY